MHRLILRKYRTKPTPSCPKSICSSSGFYRVVRFGKFLRRWDKRRIQRYLCYLCKCTFSDSSFSPAYRQHKPYLNDPLSKWYASCGSQRRSSVHYGINFKTSVRKFRYIATQARIENAQDRLVMTPFMDVQFDEMESIEHTKLKPLSIPLMVDAKSRKILGFEVCLMPAKGLLAKKSRNKYGQRLDHRRDALRALFEKVSPIIASKAQIKSDSCPRYESLVKKHFPEAQYTQVISREGCVTGQGELKKIGHDPLFSLNHTAAMIRANVNRMFRRTWCTTKRLEHLSNHLEIYTHYHNRVLTTQ
jgi:transposase-like protein